MFGPRRQSVPRSRAIAAKYSYNAGIALLRMNNSRRPTITFHTSTMRAIANESPVPEDGAHFTQYSNYSGFIPISSIIFFCSAVQVPVMSPCCSSSFLLAYISFVVWNSFTLA